MFHDSVEVDEQRYPIRVEERSLICDSGGAGRCRGGLGGHVVLRVEADATAFIYVLDGNVNPPQGVRGGGDGGRAAAARIHADGTREPLPGVGHVTLAAGERIESWSNGGGGYGDPMERDAALVLEDVLEGWVSLDAARERYGVAIVDGEVDEVATQALRRRRVFGDAH
jgi:N-methylhydantoinase B